MNEELEQTKDILEEFSDLIHHFIADQITEVWYLQVLAKFLLLALIIFVIDFLLKFINSLFFVAFKNEERFPIINAIHKSKVTNSLVHLFTLSLARLAVEPFFKFRHPNSYGFFETFISVLIVIVMAGLAMRFLKALEYYFFFKKDHYRIVALKAVSQTIKIFGIFFFSVIIFAMIFNISNTTILGSLGAITAVLVLIFRDTILGFVTGLHVATSKTMKTGDWVEIPKYKLEGFIQDINLLTTKILNFDKTVSTIPTYDLMSTEVKNLQVMSETNTRRIKRAIYFNMNSLKFLDEDLYERLSKINFISDYLAGKKVELDQIRQQIANQDKTINGQQLTNIGTFRVYALNYLRNHPRIDQTETLLVRQLEISPQGLPLEIYAFTNDSMWEHYEEIQSDIFDHLLTACKEFDLEIAQLNFNLKK